MARQAIAVIALAPGEIGYYDDYSRIYLSNESPKAVIYAGTNLFQIRKSIASGRLRLVQGSLSGEADAENTKTVEVKPVITPEPVKEEVKVEPEPIVEASKEEKKVEIETSNDVPQQNAIEEVVEQAEIAETVAAVEETETAPKAKRRAKKVKAEEAEENV